MKSTYKFITITIILITIISCNEKKPEAKTLVKNESNKTEEIDILVGTYTNKTSRGIYKLAFNPVDGSLENKGLMAEIESPSYLVMSNDKKFVYTVHEKNPGKVSSFKWNNDKTKLELISNVSDQGSGPCYIEINKAENLLSIANYGSGNIAVFNIENGTIKDNVQTRQHEVSESIKPNRDGPHAHCVKFDANGKFLYAVDLGIDQVVSYPIDSKGQLGIGQTALQLDKGDGARHMVFHPTKDMAFVINELSNSVSSVKVNRKIGMFETIDKKSTLPAEYSEKSYCADIHISSNGKYLYASNRGHNSIAVFSVSEDGKLKLLETTSVQGAWPRNFTLSPDGRFLLVANQNSDNITVFKVDQNTGLLTYTGTELKLSKPVCLVF